MDEISTLNPKSPGTRPLNADSPVSAVQTTMDKLLSTGHVEAVYGTPIHEGETIVIPAAEVLSIAGFGLGSGGGSQGSGERENTGSGGGG